MRYEAKRNSQTIPLVATDAYAHETIFDADLGAEIAWLFGNEGQGIAPALAMLHREPARRWTVTEIAAGAAVSRSALDERFRQVLGRSPIRYLADWRMHLAQGLLATTDVTIFAISRQVGYESEEAFSRAFKRARGTPPSHWRAARQQPA